jgi:hypothetical protein
VVAAESTIKTLRQKMDSLAETIAETTNKESRRTLQDKLDSYGEQVTAEERKREKLLAEAPGILTWAVKGCLAWQRDGLGEPAEVRQATEGYRSEMDVIGHFIEDLLASPWQEYATARGWASPALGLQV